MEMRIGSVDFQESEFPDAGVWIAYCGGDFIYVPYRSVTAKAEAKRDLLACIVGAVSESPLVLKLNSHRRHSNGVVAYVLEIGDGEGFLSCVSRPDAVH